jgi:hypothetical protein
VKLSGAAICRGLGAISPIDVVWEPLEMLPTGGVIHGRDAVLEQ